MATMTLPVPVLDSDREERSHGLSLSSPGTPPLRRVEMKFVRGGGEVLLHGRLWPTWPGAEVEVVVGDCRKTVALPEDGVFDVDGLPADCPHANVFVRGGDAPALGLFKLPID